MPYLGDPELCCQKNLLGIFWEQLDRTYPMKLEKRDLTAAVEWMAEKAEIEPFAVYIQKTLEVLSNWGLMRFDEKYLKIIILTLLNQEGTYMLHSEMETEKGYADLFLTRDFRYAQYTQYEWFC